MRIYFAGPVRGPKRDAAATGALLAELQRHGTVLNPHIASADPVSNEKGFADRAIFERDVAWLKASDLIVAEISHHSHGVGYEIGLATQLGKGVLCLRRRDGERVSAMVSGNPALTLLEYGDPSELAAILPDGIKMALDNPARARRPFKLATLVYARSEGRTLMVHRVKKAGDMHEGKWNGLGGKFEAGETPEECAARELKEESGLVARRLELKGLLTFPAFSKGEDWYVFAFTVPEFTGELGRCEEGELRWIPDGDLMSLNLWEGDRHFIPWLMKPGFFSARFFYEDGRLTGHEESFY